jgi:hypothetical protein
VLEGARADAVESSQGPSTEPTREDWLAAAESLRRSIKDKKDEIALLERQLGRLAERERGGSISDRDR